jgi:hypothetical protein
MLQVTDANNAEIGPTYNNNFYAQYLFMVFIMIGSIFCINLFVAMISLKFEEGLAKS